MRQNDQFNSHIFNILCIINHPIEVRKFSFEGFDKRIPRQRIWGQIRDTMRGLVYTAKFDAIMKFRSIFGKIY